MGALSLSNLDTILAKGSARSKYWLLPTDLSKPGKAEQDLAARKRDADVRISQAEQMLRALSPVLSFDTPRGKAVASIRLVEAKQSDPAAAAQCSSPGSRNSVRHQEVRDGSEGQPWLQRWCAREQLPGDIARYVRA